MFVHLWKMFCKEPLYVLKFEKKSGKSSYFYRKKKTKKQVVEWQRERKTQEKDLLPSGRLCSSRSSGLNHLTEHNMCVLNIVKIHTGTHARTHTQMHIQDTK